MIDRHAFFAIVTKTLFGGLIDASQVAGIDLVLDEWERRSLTDLRQLAYMLGTDKWETNATMQPVCEAYWMSEAWRRQNLRYYPFYGRGLPQLTWQRNYAKMTDLLKSRFEAKYPGFDLVKDPDRALIPEIAVAIMFEGMLRADSHFGDFTGLALEDFFNATTEDFIGARKIINGLDHAGDVAELARGFWHGLGGPQPAARILNYGMHGDDVADLQKALIAMGYMRGAADGDFGPATYKGVIGVQSAHQLEQDGIVGGVTRAAIWPA